MNLPKKEEELLSFIKKTTMGLVSTTTSEASNLAYRLHQKGLLERKELRLPFCGSVMYWLLTEAGQNYKCKQL